MKMSIKAIMTCVIAFSTFSCQELVICKEIELTNVSMLFDISDPDLYKDIVEDLNSNLSHFMKQTKFANIEECEQATLTIGNLSAKDEFVTRTRAIVIDQKGLSGAEIRKRANPTPVMELMKSTIKEYTEFSKNKEYTSSTTILVNLLKCLTSFDEEADNSLLIFSDMVINNKAENINFYREIPEKSNTTIITLADKVLLDELHEKMNNGLRVNVIVVLKSEPHHKVKKRDIKEFWIDAFKVLGLENVQFIDNLSNKIVWETK